jgi:hypothetical protein
MKPDLKTERMDGFGAYEVDGNQVNYLFGLDFLCQKYVKKEFTILELGVNNGVSTSLFSYYANKVVAVDIVKTEKFKKLLELSKNIEFHLMEFDNFFKKNDELYDLIYIDGSHTYEDVKKDILNSKQKLKQGGYLSGHDFNSKNPDVKKAVFEFFDEESIELFTDSSWLIKL